MSLYAYLMQANKPKKQAIKEYGLLSNAPGGIGMTAQVSKDVLEQGLMQGLLSNVANVGTPMLVQALLGKAAGGVARQIVNKEQAKKLNTERKLPDDDVFRSAVSNTPGAKITEDGLVMRVTRNQKPEQGLQESVRGGVMYLPEGAAQQKHYSTGKHGYGGTERIKGETLVSNPMFVKGATGGKAPEAAYDSINGKGSYQRMREDALKAYGVLGSKPSASIVDEFLDKYAPEMSGLGGHILKNSGQGNQLSYALQEAAVSSAVRRAGNDAVLGYSVSRGTRQPFISELFDVREKRYPDKFGTPADIWPDFLNNGLLGR